MGPRTGPGPRPHTRWLTGGESFLSRLHIFHMESLLLAAEEEEPQ